MRSYLKKKPSQKVVRDILFDIYLEYYNEKSLGLLPLLSLY